MFEWCIYPINTYVKSENAFLFQNVEFFEIIPDTAQYCARNCCACIRIMGAINNHRFVIFSQLWQWQLQICSAKWITQRTMRTNSASNDWFWGGVVVSPSLWISCSGDTSQMMTRSPSSCKQVKEANIGSSAICNGLVLLRVKEWACIYVELCSGHPRII